MRRQQILNMQVLIDNNKKEILSNKKELAKIERRIDEKYSNKLTAKVKNS